MANSQQENQIRQLTAALDMAKTSIPRMIREFEGKILDQRQEQSLKVSEMTQKIRQLKSMIEVFKSTQDSSCQALLKNGSKLNEENQRLVARVKEQENALEMHLQTSKNVATLKE